jgi:antitoxin HigA-1
MVSKEIKNKKDPDLKPIHPGDILKTEFLDPLKLTEEKLAKEIQIAPQIIHDLTQEKISLTVDLAYRLYFYFGVSAEY